MTDSEIIKALEENTAEHLAVYMDCVTSKGTVSISPADILGLINRQKAEIERLKDFCDIYSNEGARAIKEFAERLKTKTFLAKEKGSVEHILWIDEIDNLVKEMAGENNG